MAYTKTSLISSPIESPFGISETLGFNYDLAVGAGASVLQLFGQKEQTKQEQAKRDAAASAAAAAAAASAAAAAAAASGGGGGGGKIPTTYLVVGGLAVAGLLVFAMRRK
jgi:fatty acid desaturase